MLDKIQRFFFKNLYTKIDNLEKQKQTLIKDLADHKTKAQKTVDKVNSYYIGKMKNMARS